MALREEFEKTGNWLFRWRSYLPLIVIGMFFLALREYEYPGHSETYSYVWGAICLAVSFFGLAIRVIAVGHAPEETSGRNTEEQVAKTLNTTGAYSIVRNPLYVGNFFMGLGLALVAYMGWLVFAYALIFWFYYERIIFAEEEFLRKKFGNEFLEWANHTPVFFPKISQYKKASSSFSLKKVLGAEYNGFLAVFIVFFALDAVAGMFADGRLEFDAVWLTLLGFGFITWVVLGYLKNYTTILNAKDR